jgi:hypothetical protein
MLAALSRSASSRRAPVHQILWLQGFRDHTISGLGFNLFNPLRRHFRSTPFCSSPLAPRSRRPKRLGSRICSRASSRGRDPTRIEGDLKTSKSTLARIWFIRKKNRRKKSMPPERATSTSSSFPSSGERVNFLEHSTPLGVGLFGAKFQMDPLPPSARRWRRQRPLGLGPRIWPIK